MTNCQLEGLCAGESLIFKDFTINRSFILNEKGEVRYSKEVAIKLLNFTSHHQDLIMTCAEPSWYFFAKIFMIPIDGDKVHVLINVYFPIEKYTKEQLPWEFETGNLKEMCWEGFEAMFILKTIYFILEINAGETFFSSR